MSKPSVVDRDTAQAIQAAFAHFQQAIVEASVTFQQMIFQTTGVDLHVKLVDGVLVDPRDGLPPQPPQQKLDHYVGIPRAVFGMMQKNPQGRVDWDGKKTGLDWAGSAAVPVLIEAMDFYEDLTRSSARCETEILKVRLQILKFVITLCLQASARQKAMGLIPDAQVPEGQEAKLGGLSEEEIAKAAGRT